MSDRLELKKKIKTKNMEELSVYRDYLRENPSLKYLFIELTDCCNLRCLHCGSSCDNSNAKFIDTDLLEKALESIAEDFNKDKLMICITGGEPLLHPDFERIIGKINSLGFCWGMTTNGTLIDESMAGKLKKLKLGTVTISIDGLENTHDDLRQVKGSYKKAVNAVRNLNNEGFKVQVTTVVHKKNLRELESIYESMCKLGIYSWRVINIEPIGRALSNRDLLLSKEEMDFLFDFIREKRFSKNTPMDVRFGCSHYLSFDLEHELRDNYFMCGAGIYVGSILCNGDIFACLDIERRPELIQGNIRWDRFSEVWKTGFTQYRSDRSLSCSECLSCAERDYCRGDSMHTWNFDKNEPMFCIKREGEYVF